VAESYLQEHGHQTLSASAITEALAILEKDQPIEVLFTDIGLKDDHEAGLHLAAQACDQLPDLKVLYTSGTR